MKFNQLCIALFFSLACSITKASTPYHWECGTFTVDATDTLIHCPQISTNYIYFTITNTSTADIYVRQIINSSNLPQGWSVNMCNPNGCWGSNVLVDTFLVSASSYVIARFDFHADTNIGIGITSVRFDDSANPSVNGATFNLHAVSLGTGMDEMKENDNSLFLYPNPVADELGVRGWEFGDKSEVSIFNANGKQVFLQTLTSNVQHQTINVSQLPSGIYFVRIKTLEGSRTEKFVKQ